MAQAGRGGSAEEIALGPSRPCPPAVRGLAVGIAAAYLDSMEKQRTKRGMGAVILAAVPMLAILAAAFWYAASAWLRLSGPPMPTTGYVALALGVVFSLLVGCGLMGLLFYSSRHGYDEPYRGEREGEWRRP